MLTFEMDGSDQVTLRYEPFLQGQWLSDSEKLDTILEVMGWDRNNAVELSVWGISD